MFLDEVHRQRSRASFFSGFVSVPRNSIKSIRAVTSSRLVSAGFSAAAPGVRPGSVALGLPDVTASVLTLSVLTAKNQSDLVRLLRKLWSAFELQASCNSNG